ncbi:MAG: 2-dehydropantoate 2-reductase [Mariprofundales bacterium]
MIRVAIAGAGAVGCHYGAQLLRAGAEVVFLARGAQLAALQRDGLTQISNGERRHFAVDAVDDSAALASCDVWLLCCKVTGLADLCGQVSSYVAADALLVTLQNGLRAPEMVAAQFPHHRIVAGTAFIGARIESPAVVLHSASGHLQFADWLGDGRRPMAPLLAQWGSVGTKATWQSDARLMLWRKMVWNIGFNAITAITRSYAHQVANDPELAMMARAAMDEWIAVAMAEGIALSAEDVAHNLEFTRTMTAVKSSMWQDVACGRPTEVDAMNGEVVRLAQHHGIDAPINRTLTALLHGMERRC